MKREDLLLIERRITRLEGWIWYLTAVVTIDLGMKIFTTI
jgi:hypothetical protein